ncbi:acyloxyacyl hydrolase [Aquiflexum sp. TKW24L]|uniref:acyloxyacyl hydrolase n=1 Tax=Aquiflexum sp. TKW24L TaxID=2942212 RepID=UPI0020C01BEE|nr:acyloxyacyl hydrolase [Aquiflexum sp. TKW24L]MCL6259611.1 acyloxyacyl hydrolase [Aquiflexum sp. TKW24L]
MKKAALIFLILSFWAVNAEAQVSSHKIGLESQYGWIIPHNPELQDLASSRPISLNLSTQWMRSTRKNWEACNCFHYLGLNLSVVDFQNPRELGQAWNLSGSFEPYLFRTDRWSASLSTGMGVSYLTRIYDPIENPRNTFFSSSISFLIFVAPKLFFELSHQWELQASFSYNHISNGGQSQPNRGMNYPMWGLGVVHYTRKADLPSYEKSPLPNKWSFYADLGFNTRDSDNGTRQPNFTLAGGTYRKFTGIIGLGGGIEIAKDFSLPIQESRIEAVIPGIFLENHFLFGKFDFSQRMVKYLSKPLGYQEDREFYQRYTLNYLIGKNIRIGAGLKAHGHVAEYMDFRLGWIF